MLLLPVVPRLVRGTQTAFKYRAIIHLVITFLLSFPVYASIQPAERIISLAPDITETLFAIGAGNKIVGVISGSDYPPQAKHLPIVGSYSGIDIEKILSLHPDLIVVWGHSFARQLSVLKKSGIPIIVSNPHCLEDMPDLMRLLGVSTGMQKSADVVAKQFMTRLQALRQHYHLQKPVTVFYQIGSYSLITINKQSWINQMIELCGGQNIFASAKVAAPEISWEAAVQANPEVIMSDAVGDNWKSHWLKWSEVSAVKNNRLYNINPDLVERMSPRILDGVEKMCKLLHA